MVETTFGSRLRDALAESGMSLAALSDRAQLVYSSVQNYASDKQNPGAEALAKIARATGINLHWLLTGEGEKFFRSVPTIAREITMRDYQELRARFSNFDNVFTFKNPWEFGDVKENMPEYEAMSFRGAIRAMEKLRIGDVQTVLAGRDLDQMPLDELSDAFRQVINTVQPTHR
ncbi:helix-turn-helix domain-containing protein [Azospirillum agricola]|uniref:helix-turn-helix domain-containing protein n=1 Tax=Azospirillum agricola TaxID=1720247 RepID=UPI000A0F1FA1|nr:helix-turn-helix transcriptional regulator [Azospirillum agricola]SMH32017.1 Transcriptional regulator, contains XRE-family HTH domain [Azospirillum lipoferum]